VLSRNVGMPIYDADYNPTPINEVRYVDNQFFNTTFGSRIYRHSIAQSKTPAELNALIIAHSNVDKGSGNSGLSSAPALGALMAAPRRILPVTAVDDPHTATEAYLAFAWDGGSATLDGVPVSGGRGWGPTAVGTHTLEVSGVQFEAAVGSGPAPSATLTASATVINSGDTVTLSWSTPTGTFVGAFIDHGVGRLTTPSGQVLVAPTATTTYRLYGATAEGGATAAVTILVDEEPSGLFSDGFESGDTAAWSVTVP
jgi:hypothetical protein